MDPPKKQPEPPVAPDPRDLGFDFELTDFGEARRVLDDESIQQFHVETAVTPEHWKRLRRGKLPTDRALSGHGIDWLLGLSPDLRPKHLAAQFPRIANALAAVWEDPVERQSALDKLLNSERRARKGFPPEVHAELVALRNWMVALRGWDEPF